MFTALIVLINHEAVAEKDLPRENSVSLNSRLICM